MKNFIKWLTIATTTSWPRMLFLEVLLGRKTAQASKPIWNRCLPGTALNPSFLRKELLQDAFLSCSFVVDIIAFVCFCFPLNVTDS